MTTADDTSAKDAAPPRRLRIVAYPTDARVVTALLRVVSGASLLVVLFRLIAPEADPLNPLRLMRFVAGFCLLPGVAVLLLRRTFAGVVSVDADGLVLEQRHRRTEIPLSAIAAAEPWLLPLPGSGLHLRLQSGRRWSDGLAMENPAELIDVLTAVGGPPALRAATRHPATVYAHAKSTTSPRSWRRVLLKFPIFALVPTLPLFRVHQIIAYGGAFGEYQQYGLGAYLTAFALYWATLTIYLLVYAAALRVPVEVLAAASAVVLPQHAVAIRRVLERAVAALYYAGVPVAVALRFMPW